MKRKLEIQDPWEYEIDYLVRKGFDPEKAKLVTIICWAAAGDLRPLQRAIAEAPKLDGSERLVAIDGAILGIVQKLISEDRLTFRNRRGAPRSPDKFVRDLDYDDQRSIGVSSNAARKDVCRKYGISEASFREALPRMRKALAFRS
jgi:hypothetical protein